jgi:hypothetical protein
MGVPVEGTAKPVRISNCDGEEAQVVGGALNVNAVIPPPVPVPVTDVPNSQTPFTAALPYLFPFIPGPQHKLGYITASFSGLVPFSTITVDIIFTYAAGAAFATIVVSETFVADGLGNANFFAEFNDDRAVGDGYQISARTTNLLAGGTINTIISYQ